MHGPREVKFTCDLFAAIEDAFNLPMNTVKVGIMMRKEGLLSI